MDEYRECPMCGCENGPMGQLGNLLHFNCRDCGMWYSAPVDPCEKEELAHAS